MLIKIERPPLPAVLEWETQLGVLRARLAQRPLWAVRYTHGLIIHEWECDWPLLPRDGRQKVRMYCPDGRFAELGDTADATGKLFHLGVGLSTASVGKGVLAWLIGMVHGLNGECVCYSWEVHLDGGGHLEGPFSDNVYAMRWHGPLGPLNADVLGIDDGEGR